MKRLTKLKTAFPLVALCGLAGMAQAQEKKVKDQAEYDLFQAATTGTDNNKKLAAQLQWKEKYPESDFKVERLVVMITTYQQLGQADKIVFWYSRADGKGYRAVFGDLRTDAVPADQLPRRQK